MLWWLLFLHTHTHAHTWSCACLSLSALSSLLSPAGQDAMHWLSSTRMILRPTAWQRVHERPCHGDCRDAHCSRQGKHALGWRQPSTSPIGCRSNAAKHTSHEPPATNCAAVAADARSCAAAAASRLAAWDAGPTRGIFLIGERGCCVVICSRRRARDRRRCAAAGGRWCCSRGVGAEREKERCRWKGRAGALANEKGLVCGVCLRGRERERERGVGGVRRCSSGGKLFLFFFLLLAFVLKQSARAACTEALGGRARVCVCE